ncbi:hypothetical protein B0H14DRAFT_2996736, partial [Mycena olivaceomarginata]
NSKTLVPKLPFLRRPQIHPERFRAAKFSGQAFAFFKGWKDYLLPPQIRADVVKTYASRPRLPIRVFFPSLPALFEVPPDNESWNRKFADTNNMIAPRSPFPKRYTMSKPSSCPPSPRFLLPIDPNARGHGRIVCGGNLAFGCVPARERALAPPRHRPALSCLDFTVDLATKLRLRQYKSALGGFRGRPTEMLASMASLFDWSYIPAGTDCRNPLLSPLFAWICWVTRRGVSCLSLRGGPSRGWTTWWGKRRSRVMGEFILEDERFHFEATTSDGGT